MPFLVVSIFLALPVWALIHLTGPFDTGPFDTGPFDPWVVGALAAVPSLVGFILIADDKNRARRGLQRTPESTLHAVELLGGWPGSFLAQQRFRHKTVKKSYRLTFWSIVMLHQVLAVDALRGWPLLEMLRRTLAS